MDPRKFIEIMATAEQLKKTFRHSYTLDDRRESVAEHCWRLSFMALLLEKDFPEIDISKVIKMCLLHDMGEAFTGDIPAFDKTTDHEQQESSALQNWLQTLPAGTAADFRSLYAEMDALETQEAKLYKALDKLEALIQHNEADIRTWLPLEYDLQLTYGNEECSFDPKIKALRDHVREDSINKIKEQNNGQKEN